MAACLPFCSAFNNLEGGGEFCQSTSFGPGGASLHNLERKILKDQKNWRLNGELIYDPPEEHQRYAPLKEGDYAILAFIGEQEPHAAKAYLIAEALDEDKSLHHALKQRFSAKFSSRKGMVEISRDELAGIVAALDLPDGHPVLDLLDDDALEDAVHNGLQGIQQLRKHRKSRGVSREELSKARQSAERIGRLGEEILNEWLDVNMKSGKIQGYRWESNTNAVAPYDFVLVENGADARRIDAKSTAGDFKNPIHISTAELLEMAQGGIPYDLYRIYSTRETTAHLRIASDLGATAASILEHFKNLPTAITVDGISINPEYLEFGEDIFIDLPPQDESDEDEAGLSQG
ncbi:MAG: protein NO VEIN domain-containing protein [Candidatus Methylumidiphilus sp.]